MAQPSKRNLLVLVLIAAAYFASGCLGLPLPGPEIPSERSEWKLDPRILCAKDGPIRTGAKRADVHAAIGVSNEYFGADAHRSLETYSFVLRAGSFFWLGVNPEGGLAGVNKRFIDYSLEISYDENDSVTKAELKSNQVFDSHEAATGKYE